MKVVLFGFRLSDPYTVLLAEGLAELCDLTVMLPEKAIAVKGVDQSKIDLQLFDLPRFRQLSNISMVRGLLQRISKINPDVVHTSDWHPWVSLLMPRFLRCPWISTVHDVTQHPGEMGKKAIPAFMYPMQWRGANKIIVHATPARNYLLTQHNRSPQDVQVIPIGSYNFYHNWSEEDQPEKPNTILFFGRIWGYKGLQYLIEAEPLITKEVPDARIVIAGHGEAFEKYQKMMVNPDHFDVHNYRIPDEKVAHFFQQSSVVVLPYIEASQSGVVSIAYAFGKPVVSTRVGGLPDVVRDGETGLLVPPSDANSLAEAIIDLLKNPEKRHRMGEQANQFGKTELSWHGIAQKTVNVYQQALNHNSV